MKAIIIDQYLPVGGRDSGSLDVLNYLSALHKLNYDVSFCPLNPASAIQIIQFKNERMEGKFPLKQICSQIFGDEFTYRDKMGFGIPLRTFFNSIEFQEKWSDVLLPSIKNRGIFNYKPLVKWMANPQKLNTAQIDAIWLMVGFEIWAKQYLD